MHTRIQRHVQERGADFATWEVPTDLPGALQSLPRGQVVVVDCLTLWLSNLLLHNPDEAHLRHQIHTLTQVLSSHPLRLFLVTNEVGMGIVPMSPLGRAFRDVAGVGAPSPGAPGRQSVPGRAGQHHAPAAGPHCP